MIQKGRSLIAFLTSSSAVNSFCLKCKPIVTCRIMLSFIIPYFVILIISILTENIKIQTNLYLMCITPPYIHTYIYATMDHDLTYGLQSDYSVGFDSFF